jgi:hypothetical protein
MSRKIRIFWIWFYGHLPLLRKIHKRIIITALKERIAGIDHPSTISPYTFEQLSNKNQLEYYKYLLNKKP